MKKRLFAVVLAAIVALSMFPLSASAKTTAGEQVVETVLFYVTNSAGEDILVSHIPVSEMVSDLEEGKIDGTNHNYSLLDRFVTTVHQEAQGFTVPEFVSYAQSKSTVSSLRDLSLTFAGEDEIAFWEMDQKGYDDADTYRYEDLYSTARYNFPMLYEYWDYTTQDYYDPNGIMTRDEVIDYILQNGEPEPVLLAVQTFSQRYVKTEEKFGIDYNMEDYWQECGLLDTARAIHVMMPMTEENLREKQSTASDMRYWVANLRLCMTEAPKVERLGQVAAPTAIMTEDEDNYYVTFSCATAGATILYNQNFGSPSYTPTAMYTGEAVVIPKSDFPGGTVTMTCRAVKDGYTDAGVTTLTLTPTLEPSEEPVPWENPYTDVKAGKWYYDAVQYTTENGLFTGTGKTTFSPDAPMTRGMFVTVLYRLAGQPEVLGAAPFTDLTAKYYQNAVAWAFETGVVYGVSETAFAPDDQITREQMASMFYRYAQKIAGADMSASNDLAAFTDRDNVSSWAKKAMRWCVAAGLISGTSKTKLSPDSTATRAQAASILMRLAKYIG